jgi:hypothetical protein
MLDQSGPALADAGLVEPLSQADIPPPEEARESRRAGAP